MFCPGCGQHLPGEFARCACGWDPASQARPGRNLASLGARLGGQLLDSLVAFGPILLSPIPALISDAVGTVWVVCGLLFAVFYFLLADRLRNGQSYGKRVLKTAVVDATTGAPCTFFQSFIRNLLLAALGIIDWVFIFGEKRQRLGDRAANTVVIKTAAA